MNSWSNKAKHQQRNLGVTRTVPVVIACKRKLRARGSGIPLVCVYTKSSMIDCRRICDGKEFKFARACFYLCAGMGYVTRSLDLTSFKIDSISSLVSWSIVASMAKYMIPPRAVRPTVHDSLVGCGITKSGVAMTAEAIIYLATFFQGKLKVKHLRAIM